MKVIATPDRMVFHVESERKPGKAYRVDLIANEGAGQCSCADWNTRRTVALRTGGKPWTPPTTCKHQRAARDQFAADLFKAMAESERTPRQVRSAGDVVSRRIQRA